ncbi:hypothetical protein PQJ75_21240 [Rhodoplanes sp. TEM]|uniref:Uncharacterized protein n=1 Tax=Rhodoplanes tepidamans TaxID=200616 RepID=A0ABT5J6N8_RHOTP|nr:MULTISPECIES: hypothetical protein [Rhodoplanes]MDC7785322.1 hypothetical protein [Rhodoplanes tepidamans]MDC7986261.1 hypothetical protein [Rhodoplanes sp. TEM]MDQ0353227.1 hypothetical protein [Rhodoplanes tepidamans]
MSSKKTNNKATLLMGLKILIETIERMSEKELAALSSGEASLELAMHSRATETSTKPTAHDRLTGIDFDQIEIELNVAESTEEGFRILRNFQLTRFELERIARKLEIAVMKQDTVLRLEEKIIEALVGSRLNSRAVRGR